MRNTRSFAGMWVTSHLGALRGLGEIQSWSSFGLKPANGVDLTYTEFSSSTFFINGSMSSSPSKGPVKQLSFELWLKYNFTLLSSRSRCPEFLTPDREVCQSCLIYIKDINLRHMDCNCGHALACMYTEKEVMREEDQKLYTHSM